MSITVVIFNVVGCKARMKHVDTCMMSIDEIIVETIFIARK